MNEEEARSTRPLWLISGLAASCAVLAYRVSGAIMELMVRFAMRSPIQPAQWFRAWQFHVGLVAGLLLAVLCTKWQHAALARRSARANYVALAIFVVLAIFPLRVWTGTELVAARFPEDALPPVADVEPASLRCRLIDGETIAPDIIITEQNVRSAKASASPLDEHTCFVELKLDSEGQERIRQFTTRGIGKRLGFWLDGDLVCSPKIHSPISSGVVYMPGSFSHQEAAEIAARINANR